MTSPFNEAKYKALLDGFEVTELKLSHVLKDNDSFRFDSEFFKKKYLIEDLYRNKYNNILLGKLAFITDGQHGYHEVDESSDISHITAKNTRNWFADSINADKLAKWVDDKNKRSSLDVNDILFSTRGTVGQCSIVTKDILPANIDQDLVRIHLLTDLINPYYLLAYLNSKFGQDWAKRNSTGMVQQGISILRMKTLALPILGISFQFNIEKLVKQAYKKLNFSKANNQRAEEILLQELDLLNYKLSKENITIKSLSESFGESGRLDSEYYQPKYNDLIDKIKTADYKPLKTLVSIKKSIEPGSDAYQNTGIPFVRVANLTKEGISDPDIHLSPDLFSEKELEALKPKKNTILLSKDGTIGIAYTVKTETNIITSGALLHLRQNTEEVLPEYLTLVLNSVVVQMQSERDAGGSIIKHWKPSEIEEVLIPVIDFDLQLQIEEKIKESFKLKAESKQLLELAKKAVEVAIEKNEEEALKLLEAYEV